MKEIAGKTAVILVLVMLACCFVSCFSVAAVENANNALLFLTVPLDIITLPIQAIGYWAGVSIFTIIAFGDTDSQIYLASAAEEIHSLPGSDMALLKRTLDSIPETERNLTIEKVNSLSETKRASLVSAYNYAPEGEKISSVKRINSLSETETVSLLRAFIGLSETELDLLLDKLRTGRRAGTDAR